MAADAATAPDSRRSVVRLLGPAFVAAIAYVDPGNVAANVSAGARYGYLLLWVLVLANGAAVLVQYLSAKLGVVTGQSLPDILGARLPRVGRIAFWAQAEVVAAATDVAEVVGGAVALQILFGLPLPIGGLIVGAVSIGLLVVQSRGGQRPFELVIVGLLAVVTIGFVAGLVVSPLDGRQLLGGLVPRFDGAGSLLLATGILGATVMPHAIYLHSGLVRDRHGRSGGPGLALLLRATRWDVVIALAIAGGVNAAMLLLAASNLRGAFGADTIEGAHAAISSALGPVIGIAFGIGLLASGLASSSVGAYAGATIMAGLLHVRVPLLLRRAVTLTPALAILVSGIDPTRALVGSQVVLSLGIPFALIPLAVYTARRTVMGDYTITRPVRALTGVVTVAIIALNATLVVVAVTTAV